MRYGSPDGERSPGLLLGVRVRRGGRAVVRDQVRSVVYSARVCTTAAYFESIYLKMFGDIV